MAEVESSIPKVEVLEVPENHQVPEDQIPEDHKIPDTVQAADQVPEHEVPADQKRPAEDTAEAAAKKPKKPDGSLERVNPAVLEASKDVELWIAERRKNWPTKQRIAERKEQAAKDAEAGIGLQTATPAAPAKPATRPCRYFARGKCRAGDTCRFSHSSPGETARPAEQGSRVYKRFEAPVRSSLFVKLVQSDHDTEDIRILAMINDLYKQGYLN